MSSGSKATDKGKIALGYAVRCADQNVPCISGHKSMTHAMARALEHEGWIAPIHNTGIHWIVTEEGRAVYARS